MPKKPVDKIRVPLNVLVRPDTKTEITKLQNETAESQGEIVDRAVALLVLGEEIAPRVRKKSRREQAIEERAKSDVVAQVAGREDIDYSDTESAPTTSVATLGWAEKLARSKQSEPKQPWRRSIREKGDSTR